MLRFCILPPPLYHLNLTSSQDSAPDSAQLESRQGKESLVGNRKIPSAGVTTPADKVVNPLQRVLDLKLLVASNRKGPTACWKVPTQKAKQPR
jgi:hypothetical protein